MNLLKCYDEKLLSHSSTIEKEYCQSMFFNMMVRLFKLRNMSLSYFSNILILFFCLFIVRQAIASSVIKENNKELLRDESKLKDVTSSRIVKRFMREPLPWESNYFDPSYHSWSKKDHLSNKKNN